MMILPTARGLMSRRSFDTAFPAMTSDTTPTGYVVSASVVNFSSPYVVFAKDGAAAFWGINGSDVGWIQIQFPTQRKATGYSLQNRAGAGNQHPTAWELLGSQDGAAWDVLDTKSGQTGWGDSEIKSYTIASPGAYLFYRLNILDNSANSTIAALAEMGFVFASR